MTQKKNRVTGIGPKLATILLSTPLLKTVEFVMTYCQNFEAEPPSELSIF
jgi:hypothetical protein